MNESSPATKVALAHSTHFRPVSMGGRGGGGAIIDRRSDEIRTDGWPCVNLRTAEGNGEWRPHPSVAKISNVDFGSWRSWRAQCPFYLKDYGNAYF